MSMSIPFVWPEVVWDASWGTYLGRGLTNHAIVDGGMLSNFPIELFISDEPQVTRVMGPKQDVPVLGLLIDEAAHVPQPPSPRGALVEANVKPGELQTVQRLMRLVNTATSAHDKMVIDAFSNLVVRLPAGGYGTTEFNMTEVRRNTLVAAGRKAMRDYFDRPVAASSPVPRGMEAVEAQRTKHIADSIATGILGQ
jgi:predicted acylesterase/phospholipase RssA